MFLSIADISYRKSNLEHAAASVENMTQGTLLIIMLSLGLLASVGPDIRLFHIHILTPILFIVYVFGIRVVHHQHHQPMWHPRMSSVAAVKRGATKAVQTGRAYIYTSASEET